MSTVNPFVQAKPMANSAEGNGSSNGQSVGITANDFLTLLVTEMKNQDPTAQTDPNEYINQLVQVNSLEQLIEINENVSSALETSGAGASPSVSQKSGHAIGSMAGMQDVSIPTSRNSGSTPAANRVAQALSGRM
jgi:flagellar basal-body rod modification protein FlgD